MINQLSKVLWTEGLFLGQQHFQQWERTIEAREHLHRITAHPLGWGVHTLCIDENSLDIGILRITKFQGVLQNGQDISLAASGVSEWVFTLPDLAKTPQFVYLCLPRSQSAQGLNAYGVEPTDARWVAHYTPVQDELDPSREAEVLLGKLNVQLIVINDVADIRHEFEKYDRILVAKLIPKLNNQWSIDTSYIPPLVQLQGSVQLLNILQHLEAISAAKIKMLKQKRNELIQGLAPLSIVSIQVLFLLQILNQINSELQYLLYHTFTHPQVAYQCLLEAVSKLSALTQKDDNHTMVHYDHKNLYKVFSELALCFKMLMNEVVPERLAVIDLISVGHSKYYADNIPDYIFEKHSFFLMVSHIEGDTDWVQRFVREIKISSVSYLEVLITSALPGLPIQEIPRPPHQIPIKSGCQYFQLNPIALKGEHWEQIIKTRSMGIFLSGLFDKLDIKLLAIEE